MKFTDEGWIDIDITQEMIDKATKKAQSLGQLRNSIRQGKGNLCGFLGEELFTKAFKDSQESNDYQHDIKIFNRIKVEVKTKDRTVRPQPHYECSIAKYNATQKTDIYIFCSLLRKNKQYVKGFILGYLTPKMYKDRATPLKKGHYDPSNGMIIRADCLNLEISRLHNMRKFCEKLILYKQKFLK